MDNTDTTIQNGYRRTSKHPSQETREKISASLRGRTKSDLTRQRIAASMVNYWQKPENFPDDNLEQ